MSFSDVKKVLDTSHRPFNFTFDPMGGLVFATDSLGTFRFADLRGWGHYGGKGSGGHGLSEEEASKRMDANGRHVVTALNALPLLHSEVLRLEKLLRMVGYAIAGNSEVIRQEFGGDVPEDISGDVDTALRMVRELALLREENQKLRSEKKDPQ